MHQATPQIVQTLEKSTEEISFKQMEYSEPDEKFHRFLFDWLSGNIGFLTNDTAFVHSVQRVVYSTHSLNRSETEFIVFLGLLVVKTIFGGSQNWRVPIYNTFTHTMCVCVRTSKITVCRRNKYVSAFICRSSPFELDWFCTFQMEQRWSIWNVLINALLINMILKKYPFEIWALWFLWFFNHWAMWFLWWVSKNQLKKYHSNRWNIFETWYKME